MNKKQIIIAILVSILFNILLGLILIREIKTIDFPSHIEWAKEFNDIGYIKRPNYLFEQFVVIVRALLPANMLVRISPLAKQVFDLKSFEISTWILMMLSNIATSFILISKFFKDFKKDAQTKFPLLFASLFTLFILFAGPIFFLTYPDRQYMGYISFNIFHNPNYILMKPFALLAFISISENLFNKWQWNQSFLMAIWTVCVTLAKPSFTITIVPAIFIMVLLDFRRHAKLINWFYLIFPLGLTATIVLGAQYYINYSGYWGERIMFGPFKTLQIYIPNISLILLLNLFSVLFPLSVILLDWKASISRPSFKLVMVNFLVALSMNYFLYEKEEIVSNNFAWGVMIAAFLLFIEAIIVFGQNLYNKKFSITIKSWKSWIQISILFMHFVCGLLYYINCYKIDLFVY